jgi:mycothiol synthase
MESMNIRRYSAVDPDDLPALARLLAATPEIADAGEEIGEDALRAQYDWPGHQATRDRWVAEAPGQPGALAGYASIFQFPSTPRADLLIAVHPAWRRRGLGSELLRRALADARAKGAENAACYLGDADGGATIFATAHGFTPVAAYTRLTAPGGATFPAPVFPDDYTIRACQGEEDFARFIESANTCYAGLWGHNTLNAEDGRGWFDALDPAGICFLFAPDGALVGRGSGQRVARDGQPTGVLDAPGAIPALRAAGLYTPLLLWSAARLARHPDGPVARYLLESWGDSTATIAAYQTLGFTLDRRETSWRLPLPAQ